VTARERILRRLAMTGGGYSNPADDAKLLDQYAHELAERIRNIHTTSEGEQWNWWDAATIPASCADLIDPKERTP